MSGQRRAQYVSIPLGPGVLSNPTGRGARTRINYMNWDRWKDSSWVRWHKLLPEKQGGWQYSALTDNLGNSPATYLGVCRDVHDWASIDGQYWVALGTNLKLYLTNQGNLYDVTPQRKTSNVTNAITTTSGSPRVNVTDNNHQAATGDFVTITGAGAVGGITLSGNYQIAVVDPNNYTVVASANASSSAGPGGGNFSIAYDIGGGLAANGQLLGYGTGPYGEGTYGTPRPFGTGVFARMRTWSLDNFGQDLIASQSDGEIYIWQRNGGPNSRATLLDPTAPQGCQRVLVDAQQQVIIACGCTDVTSAYNAMLVRWCSFGDITDWVPTDVNTAGDDILSSGSRIVTALKTKGQNLIWTDKTLYRMVFVGEPDIYDMIPAGDMQIVGPNAAVDVDGVAYCMGYDNFYNYSGTLNLQACDVWETVYDPNFPTSINRAQAESVVCYTYEPMTEVTWLYQSLAGAFQVTFTGSPAQGDTSATLSTPWTGTTDYYELQFSDQTSQHVLLTQGSTGVAWKLPLVSAVSATATNIGNDRYVTLNWEDGVFYYGAWNRTCGQGKALAMGGYPYGTNGGYLYQHEISTDAVEAFGVRAIGFSMQSLDITIGGAKSEYTMGGSDARFAVGGSDAHLLIRSILPDWKRFAGEMNITLFTKDRPQDAEYVQSGPVAFDSTIGQIDIDAHGSQVVMQFDNYTDIFEASILLHFDGNFQDSSPFGNTVTVTGGATLESSIVKFGSGAVLFDGSSGYLTVPVTDGDELDIGGVVGNAQFTVEFWCYPLSLPTHSVPFCYARTDVQGEEIRIDFGSPNQVTATIGGANMAYAATSLGVGAWHHIALTRVGSAGHIFVDGVEVTGSPFIAGNAASQNDNLEVAIGASPTDAVSPNYFHGYIDEFRIVKGEALYVTNFTPPAAPLSPGSSTPQPSLGCSFRMGILQGLATPYAKR